MLLCGQLFLKICGHMERRRPIAWSNTFSVSLFKIFQAWNVCEKSSILATLGDKICLLLSKFLPDAICTQQRVFAIVQTWFPFSFKNNFQSFSSNVAILGPSHSSHRSQCVVTHFLPRAVCISTTSHTPNSAGRSNSSSSDFCNILMAFETLCKVHIFSSRYCGPSHFHKIRTSICELSPFTSQMLCLWVRPMSLFCSSLQIVPAPIALFFAQTMCSVSDSHDKKIPLSHAMSPSWSLFPEKKTISARCPEWCDASRSTLSIQLG